MKAGILRHKILGSQSETGQAPLPFSSRNLSHLESGDYATEPAIVTAKDRCFLFWVSLGFGGFLVLFWFGFAFVFWWWQGLGGDCLLVLGLCKLGDWLRKPGGLSYR